MTNPDEDSTELLAFSLASVYSRNCSNPPRSKKRCICVRVSQYILDSTSTVLHAVYTCVRSLDPRTSA